MWSSGNQYHYISTGIKCHFCPTKTNERDNISNKLLITACCVTYSAMRSREEEGGRQGFGSQREEYGEEATDIWFIFIILPEPGLQMNVNVDLCLLDVYVGNCLLILSPQLYELMILWLRVAIAVEFLCLTRVKRKSITLTSATIYIQHPLLF